MRPTAVSKWAGVSAVLIVALFVAGCTTTPTPRYIESVDSSNQRVKFLFKQQQADGDWERGIIECDIDGDTFEDCRHIEMEYR